METTSYHFIQCYYSILLPHYMKQIIFSPNKTEGNGIHEKTHPPVHVGETNLPHNCN